MTMTTLALVQAQAAMALLVRYQSRALYGRASLLGIPD